MKEEAFWAIIDATHDAEPETQLAKLDAALKALSADEIIAFDAELHRQIAHAYRWDLWGAAYVIHGGCGDDSFEYFRCWLIAQGRAVFEAALAAPDDLADRDFSHGPEDGYSFEEFAYVPMKAWAAVTGKDDSKFPFNIGQIPDEPAGEPWEEDDEDLARLYPKLWARFADNPL